MNDLEYSIIIPVRNEKGNLIKLNNEINQVFGKISKKYETIYVDDGSSDGSLDELKNLKNITIIELNKNYGQATALDAGFKMAQGKIIISIDGDGQNDPKDIPKLLEKMKKEKLDVVCGWRKQRESKNGIKILTKIGRSMRKLLIRDNVHDTGCTLRAYTRTAVRSLDLQGEMHRYILASLSWKGFKIGEVVVNDRKREHGVSKYNYSKATRGFIDLINVWFLQKYSQRPSHWFGMIGLFSFFVGIGITIWAVLRKILVNADLSNNGWFVIGFFLTFFSVILFFFGMLFDMLIRIKFDVSKFEKRYYIKKVIKR